MYPSSKVERFTLCPYNDAHLILTSRIQYHLTKCRKNYPSADFVICPHNATHHVPRIEMACHLATCSGKRVHDGLEQDKKDFAREAVSEVCDPPLPVSEENWDDDLQTTSYLQQPPDMNKQVFRILRGACRSERVRFRKLERSRFQNLKEANAPQDGGKDRGK